MMSWLSFTSTWSLVTLAHLVWAHGARANYHAWFASSRTTLSRCKYRGLGSRGHRAFGVVPLPRLTPSQFRDTFAVFVVALAWLATTHSACAAWLAFVCYFLYFGQLFAESSGGMHGSLPIPAVLWYAATSASSHQTAALTQWHMLSLYAAAGACKVAASVYTYKWWGDGTTLAACTLSAMCSRPAQRGGWNHALRRYVATSPRVCALISHVALVFECILPLCVLRWSDEFFIVIGFGVAAAAFHVGNVALVGIDFVTGWCPALLAFAYTQTSSMGGDASDALDALDVWAIPLLAWVYLVGQLVAVASFNEATGGTGPMPLSCMPMFALPTDVLAERSNMVDWFVFMDGDMRAAGHHGVLEWSGPPFASHAMSKRDLARMPFRVLMVGDTMCVDSPFMRSLVSEPCRDIPHLQFANFVTSPELDAACLRFTQALTKGPPPHPIQDEPRSHRMFHLVLLVGAIHREFNKCWKPPTFRDARQRRLAAAK